MCSEVSGDGAPAGSTSVSFGGDTDMIDMVACRSIAACPEVTYASPGCPVSASLGTQRLSTSPLVRFAVEWNGDGAARSLTCVTE